VEQKNITNTKKEKEKRKEKKKAYNSSPTNHCAVLVRMCHCSI